jgi:hypothetical protein
LHRLVPAVLFSLCLGLAGSARANCNDVGQVKSDVHLFHGTGSAVFDWRNAKLNAAPPFKHPDSPDGPAWFAEEIDFSIHAGLLDAAFNQSKVLNLYSYQVKQASIAVLACDTHADFKAHTKIDTDKHEDPVVAHEFCSGFAKQHHYNGYVINKDRVRGSREVIVCAPAEVLKKTAGQTLDVTAAGPVFGVKLGQATYLLDTKDGAPGKFSKH